MTLERETRKVGLDTPEFAVPQENLIPVSNYLNHMQAIPPSRMFEIKKALDGYKARVGKNAEIFDGSQGDGGASLPGVPADILRHAAELQIQHGTGYDQPFGTPQFRTVTAEKYWKLDTASGWTPENIIFVQGGRDGLNKAYNAMASLGYGRIGDLIVVSRVPWISYNWGPYSVGMNVLRAPGQPEDGWRYTPESIQETARFAEAHGRKIAGLVITSPDNPTGRTTPLEEQIELAHTALRSGYAFVLFDWIYHWITDGGPSDINTVLQAFDKDDRERLIFLDGLTKSLGASNIRSAHLVAGSKVIKHINGQASHGLVPGYYAQAVAIAAYEQGFAEAAATILEPTKQSRQILREALEQAGVPYIIGDGYYAFIDVTRYIENGTLPNGQKPKDSADLNAFLGEQFGVVVVPGVYFSDAGANWVRFSYALPPEKTRKAAARLFEGLDSLL
jgi:aspartate/methionine/tyrosine aminotransferase